MPLVDFDPYGVLNLKNGCIDAQIVKAFKRAALKWHPDKNTGHKQADYCFSDWNAVPKRLKSAVSTFNSSVIKLLCYTLFCYKLTVVCYVLSSEISLTDYLFFFKTF